MLLFQRFRFTIDDVQFLRGAQSQRCKSDSYQRLERLVFNIKVTNDTAERASKYLKTIKTFKLPTTKHDLALRRKHKAEVSRF